MNDSNTPPTMQARKGNKKQKKWQPLDMSTFPNVSLPTRYRHTSSEHQGHDTESHKPSTKYIGRDHSDQGPRTGHFNDSTEDGGLLTTAMGKLTVSQHVNQNSEVLVHSGGFLKQFTCFKELPTELRVKIWRTAALVPRMLEVGPDEEALKKERMLAGHYGITRITPMSSKPPAIMHACVESRQEGKSIFKLWKLGRDTGDNERTRKTWINPYLDTIYFGEWNSLKSIVCFLGTASFREGQFIERVAVICSGSIRRALYNWEPQDPANGLDEYACFLSIEMAQGCTPMQALHGIDQEISYSSYSVGSRGLKKIFWVIPTKLFQPPAGTLPQYTTMREPRTDGLTSGQIRLKSEIDANIALVNIDQGIDRVGTNKWVGKDKPEFQFVSLCPPVEAGKVYDSAVICGKEHDKLTWNDSAIVKSIERETKCKVTLCEKEWQGQKNIEVGFYGTEKEVEAGIELMKEKLTMV